MSLPSPFDSAIQQTTIDTIQSTNNDVKNDSTCESAISIVTIDIEQTVHQQESNKSKESSSIQNQNDATTQQDFIFEKEMNYVNENEEDDDIPLGKMPIKLTYSNMLHHDMGKRGITNKDAVISAWIDNVAHTPTMAYDNYNNNNTPEAAHIYDLDQPYTPSHYRQQGDEDMDDDNATLMEGRPIIQETKDVFTDAQKMAYVGLCAVTSLEVVHDFKGKEFTYARMSADNWQRKLMRAIYMHMDISPEEIKMIESLSKHDILPTDFVFQFTSQGETATVNVKDFKGKPSKIEKKITNNEDSSNTNKTNENSNNDKNIENNSSNRNHSGDITRHSQENEIENEPFFLESLPPLPPSPTNSSINNSFDDSPLSDSFSPLSSFMINNSHIENEEEQQPDKNNACSSSTSQPNETIKKEEATPDQFVIDLRWTVMCDLYLICLSLENYDARSRVFIQRIANYFSLDYHQVLSFERRITDHLIQMEGAWETQSTMTASTTLTSLTNTTTMVDPSQLSNKKERTSRNNQRKKKRYVMIGLATIGGGLILGLSAGLMAPVIAGGLGALLTTVGVTGTSTFLGGTAGIGLITGAATLAGSRIGAVSMNKRMKSINTFEFIPVHVHHQAHCIISITGWLPKTDDKEGSSILPFSTLDPIMGDHYNLFWEPEMLEELGSAFKIFATEAVTFSVQQALGHTIMGALLAGLAWPLALTKLGYLVDNPWANGLDRARSAGLVLADALMNRNVGARPVTLIGYSLGARVIFYCLEELARVHAFGLVENVALFGTPVSASKAQWRECTSIVSGRFINGYATNDWLLGFLFRATNAASTVIGNNVAGLHALEMIQGNRVQNLDCTDLIKGHLSYRMAMPKLLKRAGFFITSEEIIENKEKESNMKKASSQQEALENDSPHITSSLSSLSSGKVSIQLPNKSTSLTGNNDSDNDNNKEIGSGSESTSSSINKERKEQQTVVSNTTTTTNDTSNQKTRSDFVSDGVTDMDIIADILANATAAAALNKNGTYSSISSGKASIAPTLTMKTNQSNRTSGFFKGFTRSRSDTTTSISSNQSKTTNTNSQPAKSHSSTSLNSATPKKSTSITSTFWSRKSTTKSPEIEEMGVEVKEIKTTLGKMIVPGEVVHPMPKINLEMPQHARINR